MDAYSHVTPDMQKKANDVLECTTIGLEQELKSRPNCAAVAWHLSLRDDENGPQNDVRGTTPSRFDFL